MRKFLQFNLGFILSVTFLVAICFAKSVSPWMLLLLFEVVLIWLVLTILYRGVPTSLCNASDANCYRVDGRKSPRRVVRERIARAKIRSDLFAVLILVVMSGNLVVFVLDAVLMPMTIASETLAVFSFDPGSWREKISDQNLDRDFMVWQGLGQFGNSDLYSQPHFVKSSFPILIGTAILWLVGSCVLIRRAYQISLRRFCDGIQSRGNEYFNVDLGRLQG